MGSGGAKKTNQMLAQQTQQANAYGNTMGARSGAEYDWRTQARQNLWDRYSDLASGAPTTVGGSAAWTDPEQGLRQDIYGRYQNLADTGGWTPEEMANYRSWTTAPIAGFYQGLKSQLERQNNAIGGYVGYNSQSAKLARDAARQGFSTAQESESGLQQMIREAKLQGLAGMSAEAERLASGHHAGSAGSSTGPGTEDYYLRQMQGLMSGAEDLPYAQAQLAGYNAGTGAVNNRVNETPAWQKALTAIVPAAANAAVGAFTGGGGSRNTKPAGWYDTPSTFSWA